jgi:hypothetical protein
VSAADVPPLVFETEPHATIEMGRYWAMTYGVCSEGEGDRRGFRYDAPAKNRYLPDDVECAGTRHPVIAFTDGQ